METKIYKRKINKAKNTNQSNLRQKIYKNPIEFILGCIPTAGYGACPEVQLINAVRLHWRKNNFSVASRFQIQIASWLGLGVHVYFPFSAVGSPLPWTCANTVHNATAL